MELLGNVGHVESYFGPFGDSVSDGMRKVHGLRQMYHMLINHFGHTRCYSLVMRLKSKFNLVRLEIVLLLMQYRCMVCAERTIGSEVVLDTPDGTLR